MGCPADSIISTPAWLALFHGDNALCSQPPFQQHRLVASTFREGDQGDGRGVAKNCPSLSGQRDGEPLESGGDADLKSTTLPRALKMHDASKLREQQEDTAHDGV